MVVSFQRFKERMNTSQARLGGGPVDQVARVGKTNPKAIGHPGGDPFGLGYGQHTPLTLHPLREAQGSGCLFNMVSKSSPKSQVFAKSGS